MQQRSSLFLCCHLGLHKRQMQSQSLFQDDIGDLDAIMSQLGRRGTASPTSFAAPNANLRPDTDDMRGPPSTRSGRRSTVTIVEPGFTFPPPVTVQPEERVPTAGSWLADESAVEVLPAQRSAEEVVRSVSSTPFTPAVDQVQPQRLEEERLLKDELLLLAEIQQCENEIELESSRVAALCIRLEAEMTEVEAQLQMKQTLVVTTEGECASRLDDTLRFHQRRLDDLRKQQTEDIAEAEKSFRLSVATRLGRTQTSIQHQIREVEASVRKLEHQKELVIGANPHSSAAVSMAVDNDSLTLSQKLDLGMELVACFASQHLAHIRDRVGDYIRKESTEAAHSVWEEHRKQFLEESTKRRSQFVTFLEEAVSKFTSFMERRQNMRCEEVKKFRAVSEKMNSALRDRWLHRTGERNKELAASYADQSEAFETETNSSLEFLKKKFDAIQESDDAIARQQLHDLQHRQGVEFNVTDSLKNTEAETLDERNRRMQQKLHEITDSEVLPAVAVSKDAVQSMLQAIDSIHDDVNRSLRASETCKKVLRSSPNNVDLVTEGLRPEERDLILLLREKKAVVEALTAEVKAQWDSLGHQRYQCTALRTRLACAMEDEAAAVHEQRLIQTSGYARLDMIRAAWEKEYQAVLGSSTADAAWGGLISVSDAIATRLAAVTTCSASNRRASAAQRLVQHREEESQRAEQHQLQCTWVALYDHLLSLNDKIQSVSSYQASVGVEAAKFEFEKLTHEAQREEFRNKFASMQHVSAVLQKESAEALEMKQRTEDELHHVARDHEAIMNEQRKLSVLQSELLQRQRDVIERGEALSRGRPQVPHRSPFADLVVVA